MKHGKQVLVILLLFTLCLVSAACGNSGTSDPGSGSPGTSAPGTASPGTSSPGASTTTAKSDLVIVAGSDMDSFDPTYTSNVTNQIVIYSCYNRLYEYESDMTPTPVLVEEFRRESDEVVYIKIYEGITFHDGSEMTAEDVAWCLNRARTEGIGVSLFTSIADVSPVDKYTIRITTNGVYATLTEGLSHISTCIVPKAYGEQAAASGDWSQPIGSGRYVFASRMVGDNIKFTAYENYWNLSDAAKNSSLTFRIIPEGSSRTIMVQTGEADLNVNFQTSDYDLATSDSRLKLYSIESTTMFFIAMDTTSQYFSNPLVRQAVNYCVDRDAVLDAGYDNLGKVNYTYVAHGCVGWMDNPGGYAYDREKARALMAEAGYADGFTVDLIVWSDVLERIALVCQAYLADINITAKITRIEANMRQEWDAAGKMPMYVGSWGCYRDPDMFFLRMFGTAALGGTNWTHYTNQELEQLYYAAHGLTEEQDRIPYYQQIQELLADACPLSPLFVSQMFALANSDLQGVEISSQAPFNFHKLHY